MAFLSQYTSERAGYSGFAIVSPYAPSTGSFGCYVNNYTKGNGSISLISSNNTTSNLDPVFLLTVANNITLAGGNLIRGIGNATIDCQNSGNNNVNLADTSVIDTIVFEGGSVGNLTSFVKTGNPVLTAVYNLGMIIKSGTGTAFNVFSTTGTATLTTVTLSNFYSNANYYSDYRFTGNAFTAQTVENILVALNNGVGFVGAGGNINLSGGTSSGASALTPAAAAARTALIAKLYTVTLNP